MTRWIWIAVALGCPAWAQLLDGGSAPGALAGGIPISDPSVCQTCHDAHSTSDPTLYMPFDGWVSTMMGNSMRDPLFLAAFTVANQDVAGSGQLCLRCHTPAAYVRGDSLPADGGALDALDLQGVQCEVCHRSENPDGGALIADAQLFWDTTATEHGPYSDSSSPEHNTLGDPFTSSSELCGQCHEVLNPLVTWRVDGGDTGLPFPLDTTYDEWAGSSYAAGAQQTCQSCHMPAYDGGHPVAKFGPSRDSPRRHVFVGGNAWGASAVFAANPSLAPYASQFTLTETEALAQLAQAATIELIAPATAAPGATVQVQVKVTNLAGHKLPTGYADGRRAFLELSVNGHVVSGAYDADAGTLVDDPQLRVYEAVHGRADAGPEPHLVLHDTVLRDSRIPPAGFVARGYTRPVGVDWYDDDGGYRSFDLAPYAMALPRSGAVTIRARLLYQPITADAVAFFQGEDQTDARGDTLASVYSATGNAAPVEMVSTSAAISLSTSSASGCGCSASGEWSAAMLAWAFVGIVSGLRRSRRSTP